MTDWKNGRKAVAKKQNGRLVEWQYGGMEEWKKSRKPEGMYGRMAERLKGSGRNGRMAE